MSLRPADKKAMYIGIDGGGTKCRATLVNERGDVLGSGLAGPANPLYGLERAIDSIQQSCHSALTEAGLGDQDLNHLTAGVGLAGVHLPGLFQAIQNWQHPFGHMYLTTDLHTACLGAHKGQDGAVIVTGTGSCGFANVKGQTLTLGGHGFLLGDVGSGAWLGHEAIKAALLDHDRLGPNTLLTEMVEHHFKSKGLKLVEIMAQGKPKEFAQLAGLVFNAGDQKDPVAMSILERGADYLSGLVERLLETSPPRISMIGGISTFWHAWLPRKIVAVLSPPLEQPEFGAIYFAQTLADSSSLSS